MESNDRAQMSGGSNYLESSDRQLKIACTHSLLNIFHNTDVCIFTDKN